ncbi:MAG: Rrf2 family transcriptional regulator [Deltaproteobacteria bacterium]|nr:Rrf2 family transcriptional regulator [Deltaproteobacteria bacterium]
MKRDNRLSVALHVLLHLDELGDTVTSDRLGPMLGMNPVVLRRTFAGLRDAGLLTSGKGHGGGYALARPLREIPLSAVYDALGLAAPFAIAPRDPDATCLLERAANDHLQAALDAAEATLRARLDAVTVADLAAAARALAPAHLAHRGPAAPPPDPELP